jgi:hypothetical protein
LRGQFSPAELYEKTVFVSYDSTSDKPITVRFQGKGAELNCVNVADLDVRLATLGMNECLPFVTQKLQQLMGTNVDNSLSQPLVIADPDRKLVFQMSPSSYAVVTADMLTNVQRMQELLQLNGGDELGVMSYNGYFFDVANASGLPSSLGQGIHVLVTVTGDNLHLQINERGNPGVWTGAPAFSADVPVADIINAIQATESEEHLFYPAKNASMFAIESLYFTHVVERVDSPEERSVKLMGARGTYSLVTTLKDEGAFLSVIGPTGQPECRLVPTNSYTFAEQASRLCDLFAYGREPMLSDNRIRLQMGEIYEALCAAEKQIIAKKQARNFILCDEPLKDI